MKRSVCFVFAALCVLSSSHAQNAVPASAGIPAEAGPWVVQLTPYLWATGLEGDVSPFRHGPTVRLKKSFSNILNDLDVAGFVNVWARHQRLVLSGNLMYVSTSSSGSTGALPAMSLPGVNVKVPAGTHLTASVRSKQFMAAFQAGYRLIDRPGFTLDTLAGVRFWHMSNGASISIDALPGRTVTFRHDEDFHWLDPLLGLRTFVQLSDRLSIQAQGDIGGFGMGADLTWSAQATLNYSFSDKLSASAGYQIMKVDYSRKGNAYNARLSGPVVGLTYRF